MSHEGVDRLRHATRYLPLLQAWRTDGPVGQPPLTQVEVDAVTLAIEALDAAQATTIATPGGRSRIPLLAAVAAASDPIVRPHTRHPAGAVALVTRSAFRRAELEALDVAIVPVSPALGARRLRGDGYVCRSGGSGVTELASEHRLLFASPAAGLVVPRGGRIRVVIIDDTDDPNGTLTAQALIWARELDAGVLAFTHLAAAPAVGSVSWPLDWPYLAEGALAAGLSPASTAATGSARSLVVADSRVAPLFRARAALARIGERNAPWPAALAGAARFARILLDLVVPADIYDAHVPGTIARSLTRRRDELDETPPSALDGAWRDVAETDWALLKADLGAAHDALAEVNHKANALGLAVEELLAAGETVEVLCPTRVAASATRTWLLEGGFAGCTDAFGAGRLDARSIGETRPWDQRRFTVLPGLAAHRHRHRIADGDVGRLVVCCYPPEAARLPRELDEQLNADRVASAAVRSGALLAVFGAAGPPPPNALRVVVAASDASLAKDLEAADFIDVAESAALSNELLDDLDDEGEVERDPSTSRPSWLPARALIVEPAGGGSAVGLLVRNNAGLDRVNQGRVSPVAAPDLAAGMLLVGITGERRERIFSRLRPYLDILHGPRTLLWLDLWQHTLLQALRRQGSVAALGDALRAAGATIRDPAIAAWASPYRIGPRDPRNVRRVAVLAAVPVVAEDAATVGKVMSAVRRRHRDIGVKLSIAVRAAAAGRRDAFDRLEAQLGVAVTELLGDITPWRVLSVSDSGWARATDLWQAMPPAAAHQAFRDRPPEGVTAACDTGRASVEEEMR